MNSVLDNKYSYEVNTYHDVFISYRRSDGLLYAKMLKAYFEELELDVFLDLNIKQIGKFPDILQNNLKNSSNFILLVTPDLYPELIRRAKNNEEDWVSQEIKLALELEKQGKISIMPILSMQGIALPKKGEISSEINAILDQQSYALDFNREDEFCIDELRKRAKEFKTFEMSSEYKIIDSANDEEYKRLVAQATNTYKFDKSIVDDVLEKFTAKDNNCKLNVLDIGCIPVASGKKLFQGDNFARVLGIDKNAKRIDIANSELDISTDKFIYETLDLESDNFSFKIDGVMKKNRIAKFDIIYCSMVLHYLKDPLAVLHRLYGLLNEGGYIIVKGSDDGGKMAYDDTDDKVEGRVKSLLLKIILDTYDVASADRKFGRKIFRLLRKAGFSKVKIKTDVKQTTGMKRSLKEALFHDTFDWRINACYLENDGKKVPIPTNPTAGIRMKKNVAQLYQKFMDDHFWYCDIDYVGIGKKEDHDDEDE